MLVSKARSSSSFEKIDCLTSEAMDIEDQARVGGVWRCAWADVAYLCRVANLLQNKPEGVHVDDLAKQSGLDADKIGRVLRMLATRHFFKEGQCHDTVHLRMIASS